MKVTRIDADQDGESHFEEIEIPFENAGEIGRLSHPHPGTSVSFRGNDPQYDRDWHYMPQRQFVVLLDGTIAIEANDGETRRFGGGDILLVEDNTGREHRTHTVHGRSRRSLFVPLDRADPRRTSRRDG